jgi:hypothetical protein
MKATTSQAPRRTHSLAELNGTYPASDTSKAARQRSRTRSTSAGGLDPGFVSCAQKLAPFVGIQAHVFDIQMWPAHAVVWLQLELKPRLPGSSGLRIERRCKVPVPDFLYFDVPPVLRPQALERVSDPLPPGVQRQLPQSDLVPLGWDPRVASGVVTSLRLEGRSGTGGGASPDIRLNGEHHRKGSGQ